MVETRVLHNGVKAVLTDEHGSAPGEPVITFGGVTHDSSDWPHRIDGQSPLVDRWNRAVAALSTAEGVT